MDDEYQELIPEFDRYAGQRWIYPNNMPIREYQRQAVKLSLYDNAMIVLPTGFGKTFIAAVVMYNFYRWFPSGKIIFVAPTRPLVTQQISACKTISGIPSSDCIELTGSINPSRRADLWRTKRVFFATPQVIQNDLQECLLPARQVKCLVIDEAHRAQGGYAYVEVVRHLQDQNRNGFRILALSATPGSNIERVKQVMLNLYISDVMFRSESSIDLMMYKKQKQSKAWTVEITGFHATIVKKFIEICQPSVRELAKTGLLFNNQDSIERLNKFMLIKLMNEASSNSLQRPFKNKGRLIFLLAGIMTMKHCYELLTIYGIRPFYIHLTEKMTKGNVRSLLQGNIEVDNMIKSIETKFGSFVTPNPELIVENCDTDLLQGHPKIRVVKETLENHFKNNTEKTDTRAIVFCKYRESVYDIVQALKSSSKLIKPHIFVGQKIDSRNLGLRQKDQIDLVNKFKLGQCNTLVATCVAEEGLDIGEIDLVICYDSSSDPISGTQRRGRTGRKRSGDVIVLLTKDHEEGKFKKGSQAKRQVEDQLYNRENYMTHRYQNAPRLVPDDIKPVCLEQYVQAVNDEPEVETPKTKKRQPRVVVAKKSTGKKSKCCADDVDSLGGFVSSKSLYDDECNKFNSNKKQEATKNNGNSDNTDDDLQWDSDGEDILKEVFESIKNRSLNAQQGNKIEDSTTTTPTITTAATTITTSVVENNEVIEL